MGGHAIDRTRVSAALLVLVLVAVATLLILTRQPSATADRPPTAEEIVAGTVPLGPELADWLDLKLMPAFDGVCDFYQEVEESGVGYCLDGLGGRVDQYVVGLALRGIKPTSEQLATIEDMIAWNEAEPAGAVG